MDCPFILGRETLADASTLIDDFGDEAIWEAASRAERSRGQDNVLRFCHWRQVERLILRLTDVDHRGTVH